MSATKFYAVMITQDKQIYDEVSKIAPINYHYIKGGNKEERKQILLGYISDQLDTMV